MSRILQKFPLLALWLWLGVVAFPVTGQEEAAVSFPEISELESKLRIAEAEEDADTAKATRALIELLKKIDTTKAAIANYRERIKDVEADEESVKKELASTPTSPAPAKVDPEMGEKSVEELEALVKDGQTAADAAEAEAAVLKTRRKDLEAEALRRKRRLDQIPTLLAEMPAEVAKVTDQLELGTLTDDRRVALEAKRRLLKLTGALHEEEKSYYRAAAPLLVAERDLVLRRSELKGKLAEMAQRRADSRRRELAKKVAKKAAAQANDPKLPEPLQEIADLNAEVTKLRSGAEGLAAQIAKANRDLIDVRNLLERTDRDHADAVEQVKLVESAGVRLGQRTGDLLRTEKRNLPRVDEIQLEIRSGVEKLTAARLKKVEWEKTRRDEASSSESDLASIVAKIKPDQEGLARELLTSRRNYLDDLINDYGAYAEALGDSLAVRRDLINRVRENVDFIERRLLWISSAPPLHASDFSDGWEGFWRLFAPTEWLGLGGLLVQDMRENLHLWLAAFLLLGFVLRYRRPHKRKLVEAGDIAAKRNCRAYQPTYQALFYTILIAIPIPLVIWFLYWRSMEVVAMDSWGESISGALKAIAFPATALAIARGVCRSRGLVQCHLGLSSKKTKLLFQGFSWAMVLVIPLVFMREGLYALDFKPGSRICFIISMAVIAGFAIKVLRPSVGLMVTEKKSLWQGCAYPVYICILGSAIILSIATYLGYYYTVGELSWRVRSSVWIVLSVVLVASVIMRLLVVSRRRVAFAQRLATFRAAQAEREKVASGEENPQAPNIAEIEADLVDITRVKEQTQSLIRMAATIMSLFLLWGVWVEVTPSLKVFDGVHLWSTGVEEAQASTSSEVSTNPLLDVASGESGKESNGEGGLRKIIPGGEKKPFVSLADLGLAILTIFLTYFAARNIPGLLEITLLQRMKLKPGGSYTVTTVVRYIIVLVGIITAFAYVDITWGKVQWIAAAITLGVGFGLQEVFANFVAGLILLFERPIRLGDFITVGGVDGTVTQIRMRATTIKDRGNKELLVPNKEFITGQLVNWTLTDVVIRIEIPVGIAYGSDTELARKLLIKVAKEQKIVLKEPGPAVVFKAFGASSLDFELRAFIRGADDLVRAASDLHFAVDKIFREHGVEIAFPQQDLHIRTVPDEMLPDSGDRKK